MRGHALFCSIGCTFFLTNIDKYHSMSIYYLNHAHD